MSDSRSDLNKLKDDHVEGNKNKRFRNIVMEIAWINLDILDSCLHTVNNEQAKAELGKLRHLVELIRIELKLDVKVERNVGDSWDLNLDLDRTPLGQESACHVLGQDYEHMPGVKNETQAQAQQTHLRQSDHRQDKGDALDSNEGHNTEVNENKDEDTEEHSEPEAEEFLPPVKFCSLLNDPSPVKTRSRSTSTGDGSQARRMITRARRGVLRKKSAQPRKNSGERRSKNTEEKSLKVKLGPHGPRMCERCGKMFKSPGSLYTHIRLHREKDANLTYNCSLCSKKFNMRAGLRCHVKTSHSSQKDFQCTYCGKCFVTRHVLTLHLRTHNGEKPYLCKVCDKSFSLACNLRRHQKIHTGEKTFKCTYCEKAFNQSDNFKAHLRTHTGDKFKCSFCDKAFTQRSYLKHHTERVHSLDSLENASRTFECSHCGRKFVSEKSLNNHSVIHTGERRPIGERPFQCMVCQKWFATKVSLEYHTRTHTGYRPFKCTICEKTFTRDISLKMHMNVHEGKVYKCDICPRVFNSSSNMRRHMRIHSGVKAFKCHLCGRDFGQKTNLDQHMWTHKAEKKYTCEMCGKGFNDKRNLVSHTKTHSKNPALVHSKHANKPPESWQMPTAQALTETSHPHHMMSRELVHSPLLSPPHNQTSTLLPSNVILTSEQGTTLTLTSL